MALQEEIGAAEKEFADAIKAAETRKTAIKALDAEFEKAKGEIGDNVKKVLQDLSDSLKSLSDWDVSYDGFISSIKELQKDFRSYKTKSVEAEKFYKNLLYHDSPDVTHCPLA